MLLYPFFLSLLIPLFLFYRYTNLQRTREKKFQRALLFFSLFCMIIALSRPVIQNTLVEQTLDAQDFIIAIDASFSMQAQDLLPTRYDVAKESIKKIVTSLPQDRFTLFAFTSNAMLISPPTTDTQISLTALQTLNPNYILTKGTSLFTLLQSVAKSSFEKKKLIILSDGGEERDLNRVVTFAKKNQIVPYIIAIGSTQGSLLYKDGKKVRDSDSNLLISRVNPLLKEFATLCGGKYYALSSNSTSVVEDLLSDLTDDRSTQSDSKVDIYSYSELAWIPITLALMSFFIAITRVQELFLLSWLLFIPYRAEASYFDFYYLHNAYKSFDMKNYKEATKALLKVTPSPESYYNLGVTYYRAKEYKMALSIFSQIKSKNPLLKQKIFYNMGNSAVKLQLYKEAKLYYQKALGFGYDEDAYANLLLIYAIKEKKDISDMLPPSQTQDKSKKEQQKKNEKEKAQEQKPQNETSTASKATKETLKSSDGSVSTKGKKQKKKEKNSDTINRAKYQIAYKAYELINKGYTDETRPW